MLENLKETKVMVEGNLTKLEYSILKELPHLGDLEVGQRFLSKYYGVITATKVTNLGKMFYSIYGFIEKDGSPRDCHYPRATGQESDAQRCIGVAFV